MCAFCYHYKSQMQMKYDHISAHSHIKKRNIIISQFLLLLFLWFTYIVSTRAVQSWKYCQQQDQTTVNMYVHIHAGMVWNLMWWSFCSYFNYLLRIKITPKNNFHVCRFSYTSRKENVNQLQVLITFFNILSNMKCIFSNLLKPWIFDFYTT